MNKSTFLSAFCTKARVLALGDEVSERVVVVYKNVAPSTAYVTMLIDAWKWHGFYVVQFDVATFHPCAMLQAEAAAIDKHEPPFQNHPALNVVPNPLALVAWADSQGLDVSTLALGAVMAHWSNVDRRDLILQARDLLPDPAPAASSRYTLGFREADDMAKESSK